MKKKAAWILAIAVHVTGCAAATEQASAPKAAALDGQVFRVAVASDRGGAPETIEMTFARGALEASDARAEGSVPARYIVRGGAEATSFEAEARAPGAVRRFRGVVAGGRIEGDLELSRDGLPPARYTFRGEAI